MVGIITKLGLEELIEKKKRGEDLPLAWKLRVAEYVNMKERVKDDWFKKYLEAQEKYFEAVKKERFLNDIGKA